MKTPDPGDQTIAGLLSYGQRLLDTQDCDAAFECQLLLAHALEQPRTHLIAWPEKIVAPEQAARYVALVRRRALGHPVAYLTGKKSFWSMQLAVSAAVLIPRPDTEVLVELALELLHGLKHPRVLDLGTGSGAIALAIANERPDSGVIATDASEDALAIARQNRDTNRLNNVQFVLGHWYQAIEQRSAFDLIVSNPPYIAADDPHLSQGDLRFEPRSALVSTDSGLQDMRTIISHAPQHLRPGGKIALEHGMTQAEATRQLLSDSGFVEPKTRKDLAGLDRVSYASFNS